MLVTRRNTTYARAVPPLSTRARYAEASAGTQYQRGRDYRSKGDTVFFLMLASSFLVTLLISQEDAIEPQSALYFMVMGPFVLGPLLQVSKLAHNAIHNVPLMTIFALLASLVLSIRGEFGASLLPIFWAYFFAYLSEDRLSVSLRTLSMLFVAVLCAAVVVDRWSDLNLYGLLAPKNNYIGESRQSLFPNIAHTGLFAFAFFALFTSSADSAKRYWWVIVICLGLAYLSLVRGVMISMLIYVTAMIAARMSVRAGSPSLAIVSIGFTVLPIVFANAYEPLYQWALGNDVTLDYLFRGATNLSSDELDFQVYRPYLWKMHWDIFVQSPFWMGVGPRRLDEIVCATRMTCDGGDTVSFLTRLLATYGLVSVCFFAQMLVWLQRHIRARETWACALFPAVVFLMMSWGAAFHPSTGTAMLVMLLLARGRAAVAN